MSERGTCVEDLKFELPAKRTAVNVKVFPARVAVCMALMTYQIPRGAQWNERAILALPLFFAIGFFGSGSTGL